MARRRLTTKEEDRAIAEAEAARDDSSAELQLVDAQVNPKATVVLSVRLPLDRARRLREIAAERGESLSDLLTAAVSQVLDATGPTITVNRGVTRLLVYHGLAGPIPAESQGTGSNVWPDPGLTTN